MSDREYNAGEENFLKKVFFPRTPIFQKLSEGKGKNFGEVRQESFDQTFSKVCGVKGA